MESPAGQEAYRVYLFDYRAERERVSATGQEWSRAAQQRWSQAQPYEQQYGARVEASHPVLKDAQHAYDATPGGIADMKATLIALEGEHGAHVLTVPNYVNTQVRLQGAQKRRASQLAAYKQAEVLLGGPILPTPTEFENEAQALEPAPLCSCIEYRYQSDCDHLPARVEQARVYFLPTSHEASTALHEARSHRRDQLSLYVDVRNRAGLAEATSQEISNATKTNNELQDALRATEKAVQAERAAKEAFFATPIGQALARARDERRMPVVDGGPHFFGTWGALANHAMQRRTSRAEQYETITGYEAGEMVDDPTPPDLTYEQPSRCPHRCADFTWAARCEHVNEDWAHAARQSGALSLLPTHPLNATTINRHAHRKPRILARLAGRH